jgi:transposase-like protein/Zn ribbon nucleic-acid-binding protein
MHRSELAFPKTQREFYEMFRTDDDCIAYMFRIRWTNGFVCPHCSGNKHYELEGKHYAVECTACGKQTSLIAGTVMERTHTPLAVWFLGAFLMATLKPGISALQFQQQAGLRRYETAFQILHKLRAAMVAPDRSKLSGEVEVDESYIGGHEIGKPGRGADKKSLVIGAVEVLHGDKRSYSGRIRLALIPTFSFVHLSDFLNQNVEPGSIVRTDGLTGYNGIEIDGLIHKPFVLKNPENASKVFPHIHRVFGNLKAWLIGTHHGVSKKHIQAYLNEHVFRFNRRFDPMFSFNTMLGIASGAKSPTYENLYHAGSPSGWDHAKPAKVAPG